MTKIPTTKMKITSIRLQEKTIEYFKELSGTQGYQSLIRKVLEDYVISHKGEGISGYLLSDIVAISPSIALKPTVCFISGKTISKNDSCFIGTTIKNETIVISSDIKSKIEV